MRGRYRARLPAIGFASVLVLLAFAGIVSHIDARRLAETAAQVDETHGAIERLGAVSIDIEIIVTTARIFVLTGEEEFVAPLAGAQQRMAEDFSALRELLDEPAELGRLTSLETLAERRLNLSKEYIDLRRRFGLQRATDQIPPGGERLATEIRAILGDLERSMRQRLDRSRSVASENHARTLIAITFFGLTSVVILLAAYFGFRRQTAERAELERQIVATGEYERERIARDLHDGLGQELTGASLRLGALSQALQRDASEHAQTAQDLQALVQGSISESRRLSHSLSPSAWSGQGLCAALKSLAAEVDRHSGVACTAHCSSEHDLRDREVVVQLFRIAQEAVNNALRHGAPRHIELRHERTGGVDALLVVDDGIGIPRERDRSEGLGLRSMRYRARMIGGRLIVSALPEGGTEMRCTFSRGAATAREPV